MFGFKALRVYGPAVDDARFLGRWWTGWGEGLSLGVSGYGVLFTIRPSELGCYMIQLMDQIAITALSY